MSDTDDRDELFESVLAEALNTAEIQSGLALLTATGKQSLLDDALTRRDELLGRVRGAETEYRELAELAKARLPRGWRSWVLTGLENAMLPFLALGIILFLSSRFYSSGPGTHSGTINMGGFSVGVLLVSMSGSALCATVGALIWFCCRPFMPGVRAGRPQAVRRLAAWSVGVPTMILGLAAAAGLVFGASGLVWESAHHNLVPAIADISYWWTWVVIVGLWALFNATAWYLWRAEFADRIVQSLGTADPQNLPETVGPAAAAKLAAWRTALSEAVLSFLRGEISNRINSRYDTTLLPQKDSVGLRQVRGHAYHVATESQKQLVTMAAGMDGGSIALSGPRGVGKSNLLHFFCVNPEQNRRGLVVDVPVVFDRREFILHLFDRVCDFALDTGLAQSTARAHLEWIRYQYTRTDQVTGGAGWRTLSISGSRSNSRTLQALPYPEIIHRLRTFLQLVAQESAVASRNARLVIGIDELDRIEPIGRARDFLNEVKAIFDVRGWLFVLSISDEALREADLAQPDRRDAFDSAVDEVIRVEPLSYLTSVELMGTRAIGMPEPFIALFHCLSGGMARDLLRTARAAAAHVSEEPRRLSELARYLTVRNLERVANAEAAPTVQLHDTLLEIFRDDLDSRKLQQAADPEFEGSFDALAAALRAATGPDARAQDLRTIREAWGLPVPE